MPGTLSSLKPCKRMSEPHVEISALRPARQVLSVPSSPTEEYRATMPARSSHTAPSSFMQRWKRSLRRRVTGNSAEEEGDFEDPKNGDTGNFISFDGPDACSSESLDTGPELSVRICREGIRTGLLDLMRNCGGDVQLLEVIEDGKNSARNLLRAATTTEKQIALLWAALHRRRELLPDLMLDIDINFCTPEDGLTALHLAAYSASPDCVRYLLEAGAEQTLHSTISPLHCAALGNSPECISLLLESGANVNIGAQDTNLAEPQDSPIHSAIKSNAPECVTLLLSAGANAAAIGEGGLTPLHIAADLGYTQCLKVLLMSGKAVEVNFKTLDRKMLTALHLAAEEQCAEALWLLLEHGADANSLNNRDQTPLHIAAQVQSLECISVLLPVSNVNAGDSDLRTPLHMAVGRADLSAETVELLVTAADVDINRVDRHGHTALHVAAVNELPAAAAVLIRYGADLSARTKLGHTAMGLVARKVPEALYAIEDVLDSSIKIGYKSNSVQNVALKLDFKPLLPTSQRMEVSVLNSLLVEGYPELIQHPLCQAFLHLKLHTVRKFYFLSLLLSFIFVMCLSLYVLAFLTTCSIKDGGRKSSNKTIDPQCMKRKFIGIIERNENNNDLLYNLRETLDYALLVLAGIKILLKFCGLLASILSATKTSTTAALKMYVCQLDNILEFFSLLSVFLISHFLWSSSRSWQTHVGAFAVLAGWTNLMILIGQLPFFGTYVAMYTCVLREFLKLLGTYACLLIGFAISFSIVFPKAPEFSTPFLAMVKTIVMMTGEVTFKELLLPESESNATHSETNVTLSANNATESGMNDSSSDEDGALKYSAQIIFVLCLLLVTIALMNLLVAIAVHDIHGLRVSAGLNKLKQQADLVTYVETVFGAGFRFRRDLQYLCASPFSTELKRVQGIKWYRKSNSHILQINLNKNFDASLPKDIVKSLFEVAKYSQLGKQQSFNRQRRSRMTRNTVHRMEYADSTLASHWKSNGGAVQTSIIEGETLRVVRQLTEQVQDLRQMLIKNLPSSEIHL